MPSPSAADPEPLPPAPPPSLPAAARLAVVGATGAVGAELIACLERRNFPLAGLRLFASPRSAGKRLMVRGTSLPVEALAPGCFDGTDIALFSAGSETSRIYALQAVAEGAMVVDNSAAFRMDPSVPLIIPEVNARALWRHRGIIANPNCAAIIAITPLWPMHRRNRLCRLILSTYQAASGAGAAAMEELREATRANLDGQDYPPRVLAHPYAFNLFSHDTAIDLATGYNGEETKVMQETRKIFDDPDIAIGVTCIRVPVLRAHAVAITATFEDAVTPEDMRAELAATPGIRIVDDAARNYFPMPRDASGQDDILVGRIRQDLSDPSGRSLALFVVGDQLLKGAALNAVQIAELLLTRLREVRA
ncbi:MAG: aspartate-semialdehyde dehydrogenase [Rhodospirillales bacterium]|nr:aspartate-semialdehyde dehydrogenase [Rhodospirillales bacterium]